MTFQLVYLQVSDIFVNVHWGCHTAIRDIFVVVRTGFTVHCIHTWDRDFLVASGDVPKCNYTVINRLVLVVILVQINLSIL